jgi:hypothetical protein
MVLDVRDDTKNSRKLMNESSMLQIGNVDIRRKKTKIELEAFF